MSFVHLRAHSEFSVVDGTLRVDAAARAARADGQGALALTDLNNLFGAIKFYKACRRQGVKPILGADLLMEPLPESGDRSATRLPVLAQDHDGYLSLCQLISRAWTTNAQRAQAWVKWEWLAEHGAGLIALSGADQGAVGQALLAGDAGRATAIAERLSALFPRRFYVEVQRAGAPQHEAHLRAAVPLASALGLPVVATHPVQFLEVEDFDAHEARVCVAEGELLANPKRQRRFTREQHFLPAAEMRRRFADLPSALANTVAIARRCNLELTLDKPQLPDFPTPDGSPLEAYFRRASAEGLERRLAALFPDAARRDAERRRYVERLEFEIETILKMGFAGYFLIVSDFITWAKANGCPVGPGRGSGAGSLVAYALAITDLDPLRYGLLFERFLNPERQSMPDFDIDFCQANRDRVIDYVKAKYGRDAVSQIATFGTMAAKAALRDVGRVLGMSYGHVDSLAKLIPAPPGKTVTLARVPEEPDAGVIYARQESPELEQREAHDEEVAELLALATRVEGIVRNVGMHAGGVLIAPGKITDFCPLYQQPGSDSAVSQYDKDDVEAIGLVKFDFLGLATLTILELAREYIVARHPERAGFSYEQLPLDDPRVFRLFGDGLTEAVFQFESRGMQAMLRDAQPSSFEDLIALVSLFRPGPMDLIPDFVARKHGRQAVEVAHPLLESVVGETYGIMVYQEQVMQAAQVLGGYTLGAADKLRRAMGKKKPEEMAKERITFRAGAAAKGIPEWQADEVFDLMEKFAGYGFNKSHAAAYALLAYHTAWLKVHAPAEFFAANMTVEADNTDKLKVLLADARRYGIHFDPPDVNHGTLRFEPVGEFRIRYGLGAIKGTGAGAIEAIVAAREGRGAHEGEGGGPFRSLFDFCARVDRRQVNRRVVEALIKAGAFDRLNADRARLLASVGLAFEWADAQEANALQAGLFDFADSHAASHQEPALVAAESWLLRETLLLEKTALGFYLSGHLFEHDAGEVRRFARHPIADLPESREPQVVAGIVTEIRPMNGQRGRQWIVMLSDGSATLECRLTEEQYEAARDWLQEDALAVVKGKVMPDRFSRKDSVMLRPKRIWSLPAARAHFGRHLVVTLPADASAGQKVSDLLRTWPARVEPSEAGDLAVGLGVRVRLKRPTFEADIDLGDEVRFWPSDPALQRWRALAEGGAAEIVYDAVA